MRSPSLVLAVAFAATPAVIAAQTCLGGASFADRHAQLAGDVSFGADAHAASGGLSLGLYKGPFLAVNAGTAHDDNLDDNAMTFSATAGYGIQVAPTRKVEACPLLSVGMLTGADFPTGESLTTQTFGIGASIGTALRSTPDLELVPFLGASLVAQVNTFHYSTTQAVGATTDHHYVVSAGMGLVIGKLMTIRPSTTLSVVEGQTSFTTAVHVSFSVGPVPHATPAVETIGSLATVWMDSHSQVYYCQGSKWYAGTAYGDFVTEREALKAGAKPEFGKRCEH